MWKCLAHNAQLWLEVITIINSSTAVLSFLLGYAETIGPVWPLEDTVWISQASAHNTAEDTSWALTTSLPPPSPWEVWGAFSPRTLEQSLLATALRQVGCSCVFSGILFLSPSALGSAGVSWWTNHLSFLLNFPLSLLSVYISPLLLLLFPSLSLPSPGYLCTRP